MYSQNWVLGDFGGWEKDIWLKSTIRPQKCAFSDIFGFSGVFKGGGSRLTIIFWANFALFCRLHFATEP